ncbi:MAG: hypothetical protein R3C10_03990 [Pirellulales bacterium]
MHDTPALPRPERRGLSIDEGADYVGVKSRLFESLIAAGLIPVFRIGGVASRSTARSWTAPDLDAFIDDLKAAGAASTSCSSCGRRCGMTKAAPKRPPALDPQLQDVIVSDVTKSGGS